MATTPVRHPNGVSPKISSVAATDELGDYFPLFFVHCPIPLFVYDWDGLEIVLVNDAALTQYGYTRDAFLRLRLTDLMGPKDAGQVEEDRASVVLKAGERLHRKADGSAFYVDIIRHRTTVDGRTLALVACPDASARMRRQADLLGRGEVIAPPVAQVADDVLHHDYRPVDDHAEVQRSKG